MKEMEKAYDAAKVEDAIYASWEKSGFFNPDNLQGKRKDSFSIVMPPPNVTGTLHVGHAVMLALEDLMIRFNRMRGKLTLWIPGTDHAAIATQTKVEKILAKENKSRQSLGREKFLEEVRKFAEESKSTIRNQIRKMGSSCDWSREAYTLDEARSKAVRTVFKMMYDDGLIYRGNRIVNWCPRCASTLADDEVVHMEREAELWTFRYSKDFLIAIATTRPETKLGDTAIAVNPKDARYKKYIGKTFDVDFVGQKLKIKIVGDIAVDPKFGTGAVGVTPAHSLVDAQMAERHNLPAVQVIGEDGHMCQEAGDYIGLTTLEARKEIVQKIEAKGLIEATEKIKQNVSTCYRCDTIIEPLPKLQWFIGVNKEFKFRSNKHAPIKGLKNGQKVTLKKLMQHVVKSKQVEIIPERFVKTYFHWIDNLRDWNISRQIWFGHNIPVWYHDTCQAFDEKVRSLYYKPAFVGEIKRGDRGLLWCPNCGNVYESFDHFSQDEDTLDTWFSSGLWTFSTLGWPEQTKDLKLFHPTAVLETGYDILFFWIARMILMTTYALGEVPFKTVYLHGLVRDEQGRKMSKSLGNIIDPLDVSKKYGTDAVRLSLILGTAPGGDSRIWDEKIAGFRNFTNKLWNISRYILRTVNSEKLTARSLQPTANTLADKWILSRLSGVTSSVTKKLEKFEFSSAGEELRDFTWNDFADWYLEISKIQIPDSKLQNSTKEILQFVLANLLKLWHPFMPFVTEAVWKEAFAQGDKDFLMIQNWPELKIKKDVKAESDFQLTQSIVTAIRNLRAEQKVPPKIKVNVLIHAGSKKTLLMEQSEIIKVLARVLNLTIETKGAKPAGVSGIVTGNISVFLKLDAAHQMSRIVTLRKDLQEAEAYLNALKSKLENKEFIARAPANIVAAEKERLKAQEDKVRALREQFQPEADAP